MGFEDDPQAKTADLIGNVKKADPLTFENKLGGSSGLNFGEPALTRSQKEWRKKKESVRFGTFSRKGQANG
jgi:hypothetical protein